MNLVKKVLVVHRDAKLKRLLVMMLADAGYDVRAHNEATGALDLARSEWFDLALVGETLATTTGLELIEALKRVQPSVPMVLIAANPELSLVVKGIRLGLADVLSAEGDPAPLLRRIRDLLNPTVPAAPDPAAISGVTAEELAEVESALARIGSDDTAPSAAVDSGQVAGLREELLRATREKSELETRLERVQHEKTALEAELRMLLTQTSNAMALQQELNDLRSQREMTAAAQGAIDAKARALAEQRDEIARERDALETQRRLAPAAAPEIPDWAVSAEEVEAMRRHLHEEETRQRERSLELQRETAQIARERRRWHEDLDLLREQETNLREYEARLRQVQAQLEADRVLWFSASSRPDAKSPFEEGALKESWQKLQRASELLEAERAHMRDDQLCARESEAELRRREETLAFREAKVAEIERRLGVLRGTAEPPAPAPEPPASGGIRSLARAPIEMARSVFGAKR
jgi:DNA-binding response OmpR family regulator